VQGLPIECCVTLTEAKADKLKAAIIDRNAKDVVQEQSMSPLQMAAGDSIRYFQVLGVFTVNALGRMYALSRRMYALG
jgi:hypothetical protein